MNSIFIRRKNLIVVGYELDRTVSGYCAITGKAKELFSKRVSEELTMMSKLFGFCMKIHVYQNACIYLECNRLSNCEADKSDIIRRHCMVIEQAINNHSDILTNLNYMEEHDTTLTEV